MFPRFDSRMSAEGCRKVGYLRVVFATLVLLDQLLMGLDLNKFFSPVNGLAPINMKNRYYSNADIRFEYSLLQVFPDSETWLWLVWGAGIVHSLLLLLGVAPRWNAFGVFLNVHSFRRTTYMFWDGQDILLGVMSFYMLFLPLHHITVYEVIGKLRASKKSHEKSVKHSGKESSADKSEKRDMPKTRGTQDIKVADDSWPMWPVWLIQWEMVLVYMGAFISKIAGLEDSDWVQGTVMYYVVHLESGHYGGIFNPDFIFNRMLPLKLMAWSTLIIEGLGPILISMRKTRWLAFVPMCALHVGIDLSMNLHIFQWLTIWGWAFFFIESDAVVTENAISSGKTPLLRRRLEVCFFLFLLVCATSLAGPWDYYEAVLPDSLVEIAEPLVEANGMLQQYIAPVAMLFGFVQIPFSLFGAGQEGGSCVLVLEAVLDQNHYEEIWRTPNFRAMPWWERKRNARLVNFYCKVSDCVLCDEPTRLIQRALEANKDNYLVKDPSVQRYELWEESQRSTPLSDDLKWWQAPEHSGWLGPVQQPHIKETDIFFLRFLRCQDTEPELCPEWAFEGICRANERYMAQKCPAQCGFCKENATVRMENLADNWFDYKSWEESQELNLKGRPAKACMDHDEECVGWVSEDKEKGCLVGGSRERFLINVCRKSCGVCSDYEEDEYEDEGEDDDGSEYEEDEYEDEDDVEDGEVEEPGDEDDSGEAKGKWEYYQWYGDDCRDHDEACEEWAENNLCSNVWAMNRTCPYSCGFCARNNSTLDQENSVGNNASLVSAALSSDQVEKEYSVTHGLPQTSGATGLSEGEL